MTENMAARGEGLAGLAKAILAYDDEFMTVLVRGHAVEQEKADYVWAAIIKQATLLEAAAPAGTAPDVHWAIKAQCAHCVDSYPQRQEKDDYISNFGDVSVGEWLHHGMVNSSSGVVECAAKYIHEALRAALATPSPQAAPDNQEGAGWYDAAATQEQPAGSEAKELLKLVWRQYGIKGDIPAETLERIEKFLGEGEIWTGDEEIDDHFRRTGLLRGSPRKVGEDGAKVGDEVWVRGKLLRVDKGYLLVEVCDGGDSFDLLCRPLDVTPRSSSVPVGEQK